MAIEHQADSDREHQSTHSRRCDDQRRRPAGQLDDWRQFTDAEINDAVKQNGEKIKEEGIVLIVANNGKIIRRGVGTIPWRQIVEELDEAVKA